MKAFLLAAGLGTRLRPITDRTPKCLVRIGGRALVDIWLDSLAKAGVDEVLVNTHHFADKVAEHLMRRRAEPVVRLAHEPELLGSAGTLRANRDFVRDEDMFLAINADNLTDFDLSILVRAHRAYGASATLGVFPTKRPSECGIVEVDGDRVVSFEEKPRRPRGNLANAGLYAFHPGVIDLIGLPPADIGYDLLPQLVGRSYAVSVNGSYFMDIGTPQALRSARAQWRERARR